MSRLVMWIGLALLLSGCMSAPEREAYATRQAVTFAADLARATDAAWREHAQATGTAQAQNLAIVSGYLAQTEQAQVVQATEDARQATQAAGTAQAQATVEAAQTAQAQASATAAHEAAQTAEARAQETAQAHAQETQRAWTQTETAMQATGTADAITAAVYVAERTATATYAAGSSQLTATAAVAIGKAQATAVAAAGVLADNAAQRDTLTTGFAAWWRYAGPLLYFLAMLLLALATYRIFLGNRVIQRQANGAAPVILTGGTVINPDMMILPNLDPRAPVYLPAGMHGQAAQDQAKVRAIQALQEGKGQAGRRVLASMAPARPEAAPVISSPNQLPAGAPWDKFQTWNGQSFLLGVGADNQPVQFDPLHTPHLLAAATSGAGKSMTILRPMAAAALNRGYQVVLANDAGGDFAPLGAHPNLVRVGEDPAQIAKVLAALAAEVDRRSGILKSAGVSTWNRLEAAQRDGPAIMLMLDELVALVRDAEPDVRRLIWRKLIKITSKGRKMAVTAVIGTTDPTERTLGPEGLTVRDNCSRVALRVLDASVSRVIVSQSGAEALGADQFMARLSGALSVGVAFHPEDEQLRTYMRSQSVPVLPEPRWLEQAPVEADAEDDRRERILQLVKQGLSLRQVEMEIFGYTGGAAHREIVQACRMTGSATEHATGHMGATATKIGPETAEQS